MNTRNKTALLVLGAAAALGVPALAAQTGQGQTAQTTQSRTTQSQTTQSQTAPGGRLQQNAQPRALQVRYYSADPLGGGKLLATKTLQPGTAGAQNQNPLVAGAPSGAKFAVIADGRGGARVIDLNQAGAFGGGRGGMHGGPGGRDGGFRGGPGSGRGGNQSQPGAPDSTGS